MFGYVVDAENVAYFSIETHSPVLGPNLKRRQVFLECYVVPGSLDGSVQEAVICE